MTHDSGGACSARPPTSVPVYHDSSQTCRTSATPPRRHSSRPLPARPARRSSSTNDCRRRRAAHAPCSIAVDPASTSGRPRCFDLDLRPGLSVSASYGCHSYTRKLSRIIKVRDQLVKWLERKQTDRRTDATDRITVAVTVVGSERAATDSVNAMSVSSLHGLLVYWCVAHRQRRQSVASTNLLHTMPDPTRYLCNLHVRQPIATCLPELSESADARRSCR